MTDILFINALIVNEGKTIKGFLATEGERITAVGEGKPETSLTAEAKEVVDLEGKMLLPGCIDDQVHFRDPGLTHKGDIETESRAALAGGVTSFMDMPNCKPPTVSVEAWEQKMKRAEDVSAVNWSFWIGATDSNIDELRKADYSRIPGVKVFLGASTGNMLVSDEEALDAIFSLPSIVAVHSEDEATIASNKARFLAEYGEGRIPIKCHPLIRSTDACAVSTARAIERARRLGTRLHLLHVSTAEEARMLTSEPLADKKITAEVCVHHLWFTDCDYDRLGARIKWNPAVKTESDREELRKAVLDGRIDIVATDHAPHLPSEKEGDALHAASGGPLVQHSLQMMLELCREGVLFHEDVVSLMAHRPAELFHIEDRGYLRSGYYADLVVVNPDADTEVAPANILTKCGWSPLEGVRLHNTVEQVFVNGSKAYSSADGSHTFLPHTSKPLRFKEAE